MIYFLETQRFKQVWLWIVLIIATAAGSIAVFFGSIEKQLKNDDWYMFSIGLSLALPLILIVLLSIARLETTINDEGIEIKYIPFLFRPKKWSWDMIEKIYVREYSPLIEYGGWGIRTTFRNGKAYNVSGRFGLQLILTNGKKVLIGTLKHEELQQILIKLKKQ